MEERWDWERDEEEREGRNTSWLPAVRNRWESPRGLSKVKDFCDFFLIHFCVSPFTKTPNPKPQVNKDEGAAKVRIHTGGEMTAHHISTATERSGFKAHCCRQSLGLQSKTSTPSPKDETQTFGHRPS